MNRRYGKSLWLVVLFLVMAITLIACGAEETQEPIQAPEAEPAEEVEEAEGVTEIWIVTGSPEGSNDQILLAELTQEYEADNPNIKVKWEWAGYELYVAELEGEEISIPEDELLSVRPGYSLEESGKPCIVKFLKKLQAGG